MHRSTFNTFLTQLLVAHSKCPMLSDCFSCEWHIHTQWRQHWDWSIITAQGLCSVTSDCDPMDCSPPGAATVEFSRQECWSGLLFPTSGDLPDPGTEPVSHVSCTGRGILSRWHRLGGPYYSINWLKQVSSYIVHYYFE